MRNAKRKLIKAVVVAVAMACFAGSVLVPRADDLATAADAGLPAGEAASPLDP